MYSKFEEEEEKKQPHDAINNNKSPVIHSYYEEYLDLDQRGTGLPYNLRLWRNRGILALIMQTVASVTGLVMYSIRQMRIGQVVNIICLVLIIFFGRNGVLTLNKTQAAIHGVINEMLFSTSNFILSTYCNILQYFCDQNQLTSSVFGVIFLYSTLECLFSVTDESGESSDRMMLFIFCLPYLADFLSGLCLFYLAYLLDEHDKLKVVLDIPHAMVEDNQLCVICSTNKIDTVFYPCGHKSSCYQCSLIIKKNYKMECPMCRQPIKDLIRVFE